MVVQYILVRKAIAEKLGKGALSAQVAHAAMAPLTKRIAKGEGFDSEIMEWVKGTFVKIVLGVSDGEMAELFERLYCDGIEYHKIHESVLNELTCVGIKPYSKGRVAPYFARLKLLK